MNNKLLIIISLSSQIYTKPFFNEREFNRIKALCVPLKNDSYHRVTRVATKLRRIYQGEVLKGLEEDLSSEDLKILEHLQINAPKELLVVAFHSLEYNIELSKKEFTYLSKIYDMKDHADIAGTDIETVEADCCVCFENCNKRLRCNHQLCQNCFEEWRKRTFVFSCPMCRKKYTNDELQNYSVLIGESPVHESRSDLVSATRRRFRFVNDGFGQDMMF